jgi:uracil-DNA glycosylase
MLPRLVFLSLDPGRSVHLHERMLIGQRLSEQRWVEHELLRGRARQSTHWYRTHELALTLLLPFAPCLTIGAVHDYFAHTNSAKCCLNYPGRAQADDRLFDNCRSYIAGELEVLRPEILVTQGIMAKRAITESDALRIVKAAATPTDCAEVEYAGGRALWLCTYHPRYFQGFYRQRRECFAPWAAAIHIKLGPRYSACCLNSR